jgi:hypothetical protein
MAYESTTELRNLLSEETGEITPSSSTLSRFLNLLDLANKTLHAGGGILDIDKNNRSNKRPIMFAWARSTNPIVQNFSAPISTGTIAATQSSTTVTFSSAPAASVAGWYLRIGSDPEVYRISAHTGGVTTATLDAAYIQSTVSAGTFEVFKLDYTFGSSVLLPASQIKIFDNNGNNYQVPLVDKNELEKRFPKRNITRGIPKMAGVLQFQDGTLTVQFSNYPENIERMELEYNSIPTALDTSSSNPVLPKHLRPILVHLAAFYHLRKRDDDRAASHLAQAKDLFAILKSENRHILYRNDPEFGYVPPFPGGFSSDTGNGLVYEID